MWWRSLRVAGAIAGYAGPLGDVGWPALMRDSQRAIWESQAQAASPPARLHCSSLSFPSHTEIRFAGTAPRGHCGQLQQDILDVTPKGCIPRRRPPAELTEISIPDGFPGACLSSKFTQLRRAHTCCLLTSRACGRLAQLQDAVGHPGSSSSDLLS
jgi:hypothetical protein